jgi:Flp pilus assembly protein TadB
MHGGGGGAGGAAGAAMGPPAPAPTPTMHRFGYYTEDKTSVEIGILSASRTRAQKIADEAALTLGWSSRTVLATRPIGLAVFWGILASIVVAFAAFVLIGTYFSPNAAVIPCIPLFVLTVYLSIKAAQRHNRKVEQLMAQGQPPHAVL